MPNSKNNFMDISDSMKKSLEEMKRNIVTFYSQEDFLKNLQEVYVRRYFSDFVSLKSNLCYMFKARGFSKEAIQNLTNATADNFDYNYFRDLIIKNVPVKKELIVTLIKDIYNIYKSFPHEEQFLARIVKRLADKDFSDEDSLRMQILKRFIRHTDYHTKVVELRVLESVSPDERKAYATLKAGKKKDFLIDHLTEDIFIPLDVKLKDWIKFFDNWLMKKDNISYFSLAPFVVSSDNVVDEKIERDFIAYLSIFNVVANGAVVCRRDELYKKNKIAFIKKHGDIFEALKNSKMATSQISKEEADRISKGIGNFCDWNLKEYAVFLVLLIKSNPPNKKDWLAPARHEKLVKLVKDLIQAKIER